MNPERAYETARVILQEANKFGSHVYFDPELEKAGLVWKDSRTGDYRIAPLKEFEGLQNGKTEPIASNVIHMQSRKPTNRFRNLYRWGTAAAACLAFAVGSWMSVKDYNQNKAARIEQQMVQQFYARHHPGLLEDGKLHSGMGMSLIDMLSDEKEAFVHGDINNPIYSNRSHLVKLAEEGRTYRAAL